MLHHSCFFSVVLSQLGHPAECIALAAPLSGVFSQMLVQPLSRRPTEPTSEETNPQVQRSAFFHFCLFTYRLVGSLTSVLTLSPGFSSDTCCIAYKFSSTKLCWHQNPDFLTKRVADFTLKTLRWCQSCSLRGCVVVGSVFLQRSHLLQLL